ncbi:hypothetical protein HC891_01010 [Candidatus Gracilibacteria bacterium]|nr:hypothetical protein [Candidatus Gracilibacteria bacterium]
MQSNSLSWLTPARKGLVVAGVCAAFVALATPAGHMLVLLLIWLCGPGYLAERLILRERPTMLLRFALWCGIGWSLVALFYQWATFAGLQLTTPLLAIVTVGLVGCCALLAWREAAGTGPALWPSWPLVLLLLVFAITIWTRFRQIADLALPAWVDSVHHILMIKVAVERGQAPLSLQPYLPVEELPYHWGYHVLIAAVQQLSGLDTAQLVLWSGQVFGALQVLTGAALALFFWRRPAVLPVVGLIIGLISFLPAYYVAWGRYTQLSGLLILPAVAISWGSGLYTRDSRWWALAAIGLAGLSLVHFRVLIFTLALLAVMTAVALAEHGDTLPQRLLDLLGTGIAALVLALPWLTLIARRTLLPAVERPQNLIIEGNYNALSEGLLWFGQGRNLIALALLAAGWGLYRRSRTTLICVLWVALIFGFANPWLFNYVLPTAGVLLIIWAIGARSWLLIGLGSMLTLLNPWLFRLPSIYLINNDSVIITLFLPLAITIGGGAAALFLWFSRASQQPRLIGALASALIVGLSIWARARRSRSSPRQRSSPPQPMLQRSTGLRNIHPPTRAFLSMPLAGSPVPSVASTVAGGCSRSPGAGGAHHQCSSPMARSTMYSPPRNAAASSRHSKLAKSKRSSTGSSVRASITCTSARAVRRAARCALNFSPPTCVSTRSITTTAYGFLLCCRSVEGRLRLPHPSAIIQAHISWNDY